MRRRFYNWTSYVWGECLAVPILCQLCFALTTKIAMLQRPSQCLVQKRMSTSWGGFPEKLGKGIPFDSRQMRFSLQGGLKDEEGSVLVGGLGDTGDARHRGKVEAFRGHDGMLEMTPE